ncbi:MAG: GNAT family N-acetyltransferase [Bacteroidota bacterium]
MEILPAQRTDAALLSQITKRSKAHWGYSATQLAAWDAELSLSEEYIESHHVFKLLIADVVLAYYSLKIPTPRLAHLDNLFVLPEHMGKGYGKALLQHALALSRSQACHQLRLDADPNATPFYLKHGFRIIDQLPTSIPNRFLPVMVLDL